MKDNEINNPFVVGKYIAPEYFCDKAVNAMSGSFVKKHGLSSASSVQSALKGLMEKDLITRTEKGYRVYDFFFAEWLRSY